MKYLTWFEGAQGSLLERSGDSTSLFPCALPYPETLSAVGVKGEDEARVWWAKSLLNSFVAWSNFVLLGCPRWGGSAYEPRVSYRSCTEARAFADRLLGEVEEFAASDLVLGRLVCEGKRATVEELLAQVQESAGASYFDGVQAPASTSSPALAVTADRIAVPDSAGGVDPGNWLPEERAAVFRDLESLRLPEHLWDDIPPACHRVPQAEEADLARKLLKTKMAVLVPEDSLPRRRDGRLLVGGLFAVAKNESEDRLIYDRRPENSTMPYLDWANLPSAACFTRLLLRPNQYLRGSGDDLRNFYYNLQLPEGWEKFNPVGRRVDARVVEEQGLDPRVHYRLCLRVLGMGDRNGCAIAQATHEGILRRHGGLDPKTTLRYGEQAPRGDLWQGVYLDDLLVVQRVTVDAAVPLDGTFVPPEAVPEDADMREVSKAEGAYDAAGLQRALHKSFRALTKFKAWGAEVDGIQGTIASPLSVRQQVWRLLERLVETGWATKEIMQKVLGFLAFAFQFRRDLFCLHHRVYTFVSNLPEKKWCRLPNRIIDELRSVALHLPFAKWKMRRRLHPSVLATDATPTSGGAVRAPVSAELNEELWRRSEIRGGAVRLDRGEAFAWKAEEPITVSAFASAISECLSWTVTSSYSFRKTSHINLQEGRALRREIARMASSLSNAGHVQVCLNDSRVIVGAVAKGRSSSYKLNGLLRAQLPFLIMADLVLALLWIETESNLADHPSRFRSLPPPKPPRWMSRFGVRRLASGCGLQIFGTTYLTDAHRDKGLMMWDPVCVWDEASFLDSWVIEAIKEGVITWLWLAPPKGSGHWVWREVLNLAALMLEGCGYVFIEQPWGRRSLQGRDTQLFMSRHEGMKRYFVDWDIYVNPLGGEETGLEQSVVLSNAPWPGEVDNLKLSDFCFPEAAELSENVGLVVLDAESGLSDCGRTETLRHYLQDALAIHTLAQASEPKHGPEELEVRLPRRSEAGTSSNSNVRRRAEEVAVDEAAKGAASAAAEALQSVAGRLKEPLDGGLTATQVLEDPQTRAAAARWPAGSGARQLTAGDGPETACSGAARPLRGSSRDHAPAEPTSWRAWLPSFSVRTVLLLICLFLFPRIIAKLTTLILRLLGRALASLVSNLIQELLSQTLQAATDMEDQVVEWLNHHLGGNSKPVVSLPQSEAVAPPPAQQPVVVSHPTRPVDLLMLLLLGLNLRQQQVGGVGEARI
ncbi:unnamed protein product [Symbiodinium microadriaticum]|nr:unnamed protein product [Symbiodinium microadriaticum]CAE7470820.1 unnamed protein product [Symbiodinium sp. KB8]